MFCSPFEPHFNNATEWGNQTRKIKICKTYVENLWGGDIDKVNNILIITNYN